MTKKSLVSLLLCFSILLFFLIFQSCVTTGPKTIPTLNFMEYALEAVDEQAQEKSDVEIRLELIRPSHVYNYPELFSFKVELLPPEYARDHTVRTNYKANLMGKSWEFTFASPDGSLQLLLCSCRVKNNTEHILRMSDARIYLIVEGVEPLRAISSFEQLLEQADYFQELLNRELSKQFVYGLIPRALLPEGFFRALVIYNQQSFKLINDLKAEILPGFSYDGILVFPVIPSFSPQAKISFFDVTTKTDKAGNPIEKVQFDFNLQSQRVQMWYDRDERVWKVGPPPEIR